jgi:hypothetical protein
MTTTQPSDGGAATDPQALKILIYTWNMGDSIPKGDLEVLYGKIPPYQPPPKPPTAGAAGGTLPDFGNTDGHPYHLIVIAAQECPTQSGVPRGIAAGVTKGMGGLREREKMKERERLRDAKERVKEMGKEMLGKEKPKDKDKEAKDMDSRGDAVVATDDSVSPITNQHTPHHGHHSVHVTVAARGWSDILEGECRQYDGKTIERGPTRVRNSQTTSAMESNPTGSPNPAHDLRLSTSHERPFLRPQRRPNL